MYTKVYRTKIVYEELNNCKNAVTTFGDEQSAKRVMDKNEDTKETQELLGDKYGYQPMEEHLM